MGRLKDFKHRFGVGWERLPAAICIIGRYRIAAGSRSQPNNYRYSVDADALQRLQLKDNIPFTMSYELLFAIVIYCFIYGIGLPA
jgi:hypothetical protein